MSPENEGLPPPPIPESTPSEYRPPPDLQPGTTERSLFWTRSAAETRTGPWQDAINMRAEVGGEPSSFASFSASGPDALAEVQSQFERAVIGDKPDPSLTGLLRAIGGSILTGTTSPIAAITDEYQVARIRELQEEFLKKHATSLVEMSEKLGTAKRALRELSELMGELPFHPRRLSDLLERKSRLGDSTLREIDAALEKASDPEERARLQSQRDDLTRWMAERDSRIAREEGEVGELTGRLNGLESQMYRQHQLLERAAWSESPSTQTSGYGTEDFRVISTTHARPDAIIHAASLQDLLLNSKVAFDRYIAP